MKPPSAIEVTGYTRQPFSASAPVTELRIVLAASGLSLTLALVDSATTQPIAKQAVSVLGHAEIRCRKAPCPSQRVLWNGNTDSNGEVNLPAKAIQPPSFVQVAGYVTQELPLPALGHSLRILLNPAIGPRSIK